MQKSSKNSYSKPYCFKFSANVKDNLHDPLLREIRKSIVENSTLCSDQMDILHARHDALFQSFFCHRHADIHPFRNVPKVNLVRYHQKKLSLVFLQHF